MLNRGMGWIPDLPDHRDYPLSAVEPLFLSLPVSADLRPQTVPLYDQGPIGSCTANAVEAMFRFVDKKQGGIDEEPSRLFNYYEARRIRGWESIDSGAIIRDAIQVCVDKGSAPEADWPYDITKFTLVPPQQAYTNALLHQAIAYFRVDQSVIAMKSCIAAGYPFVLGSTLYENFELAAHTGIVPMPSGGVLGGHALMYLGYDDIRRWFIAQGSWGLWGDQGFLYVPYDYATNPDLSADCWTIRAVEEEFVAPPPPPPPPPAPDTNFVEFDATVLKAKAGKFIVKPDTPVTKNLTGRNVRVEFSGGEFTAIVKNMDDPNWVVLKPVTFDAMWSLVNKPVHIETV